ncbi:MAG: hypothetical protein WB988_24335 [Candidatus Nitrosopolaris sp.]
MGTLKRSGIVSDSEDIDLVVSLILLERQCHKVLAKHPHNINAKGHTHIMLMH